MQNKAISKKLAQKEEEENRLTHTIKELCAEIPHYNIQPNAPLLQKVRSIANRAKNLE